MDHIDFSCSICKTPHPVTKPCSGVLGLTHAELNWILAAVGEECGEVQQVVGKSTRFGIFDNPPTSELTNFDKLVDEFHDIVGAYVFLCQKIGRQTGIDDVKVDAKVERLKKYMQIAREQGSL